MFPPPNWPALDSAALIAIKFGVASAATVLLAWCARTQSHPGSSRTRRVADRMLVALAVVAFASWWNLGRFHFPQYWHSHEFFHYFVAAKYSTELGYTRLYDCAAAAEMEAEPAPAITTRWTRNLRTNIIEAGSPAARDVSLCRAHFSDDRWRSFKQDVLWFRARVSPEKWARMQMDHGYNGTPVWTMTGHLVANTGLASKGRVLALALIDPVLLLLMWGIVWWVFGWRVLAIAVIWWGTNYPARYNYIGGAFLRADWLALAVVGIALAKRRWFLPAGLAFGWSTVLRVFPGFAAAGLLLSRGANPLRADTRRELGPLVQFVAGAIISATVLVLASGLYVGRSIQGGVDVWTAFAQNSRKHLSAASTNRVGLETVISYDPASRWTDVAAHWLDSPGDTWQAAREQVFTRRRPLYWLLVLAFVALLARAVRGQPEWVALVLGIGLIPIATNVTCYYYGILLAYAFLSPRHPWVGVALCALSAYSCLVVAIWPDEDVRYAAISLGIVLFVFTVTAAMARVGKNVSSEPLAVSATTT